MITRSARAHGLRYSGSSRGAQGVAAFVERTTCQPRFPRSKKLRHAPGPCQSTPTINDLAIRVGTVNGSGSQSANLVILRSLYAMGIPCSGKNVFPSNIEGLPTWFHIRASGKGYVGHVLDPQVLVCMNEQTAKDDALALKPGAICIYRDDFDVDLKTLRNDVHFFPVPFQKLVEKAYPPDKADKGVSRQASQSHQHGLRGGAGGGLQDRIRGGRAGHSPRVSGRKAKAGEMNINAARTGFEWATANLPADLPFQVKRMASTSEKILIEGNKAAALGSLFGGASVLTWYPITPSSSLAEYAEEFLKKHRVNAGREEDLRRRAGRGRAGGGGHGHRGGLGRSAGADGHGRAGNLADVGVRRAGLFRRDSGRHHRRAADGAEHGPAHPDQPGRHPEAAPAGARRLAAHRA